MLENQEELEYNQIINSNPFDYEQINSKYKSLSFDDYIVTYKDKQYRFSDIIVNPTINYQERIRFTKSQLKKWVKEYQVIKANKHSLLVEEVKRSIDDEIKQSSSGVTVFLLIVTILIALFSFLSNFILEILKKLPFNIPTYKLEVLSNQMKMTDSKIFIAVISMICIFIVMYIYMFIFNNFQKRGQKYIKKLKSLLKARSRKNDIKVRKATKRATKYYIKVAKEESTYKPLLISDVQLDFTIGDRTKIDKRIVSIVKSNKYLKLLQVIVYIFRFSLICSFIAYGVLFYLL